MSSKAKKYIYIYVCTEKIHLKIAHKVHSCLSRASRQNTRACGSFLCPVVTGHTAATNSSTWSSRFPALQQTPFARLNAFAGASRRGARSCVIVSRVPQVETVGDKYMAVSGLPEPCEDHVRCIARLALDMMDLSHTVVVDGVPVVSTPAVRLVDDLQPSRLSVRSA